MVTFGQTLFYGDLNELRLEKLAVDGNQTVEEVLEVSQAHVKQFELFKVRETQREPADGELVEVRTVWKVMVGCFIGKQMVDHGLSSEHLSLSLALSLYVCPHTHALSLSLSLTLSLSLSLSLCLPFI